MQIQMTRTQQMTLISSLICFGLTIFSYLMMDSWVFLLCLTLFTLFILLFSLLAIRGNSASPNEIQELTDRIENIRSEWREDSDRLKEQISEKETELEALKEEVATRDAAIIALEEKASILSNELLELKDTEEELSDISSVLPQLLPEASESTTVDIIQVVKSVSREFHDDAAKAGLTVRVSSSEDSILVKADQNILRIMFRNIVDNSIKYMNRHGSLVVTLSLIDDDIFIVLKDTGEGLAEDETRHIFELNYQGSNRISGNGLGLFQAKAIVEYYGGTIYARSGFGKGMGIYIQLPSV